MAYTPIDKPTDYFNTKLYTGSSSAQSITGVGFQPDWVWIKNRTNTNWHNLFDSVRGNTKVLYSNDPLAEGTETQLITSFDSDGFSVGTNTDVNSNTIPAVSWNWLAGGTASSNSNGSITSSVSANTTAGFSIVSYTGTGSNATVGHGLSSAPEFITIKNRNDASSWLTYLTTIGAGNFLRLNENYASASGSTPFNNTASTSSVFSVGANNDTNGSSDSMIAYCFSSVRGYSKIGSYTGNGNADGTFVYTGFKPAWILAKNSSASTNWQILDNKRDTFNTADNTLYPDGIFAEGNGGDIDFLSNGFKVRNTTTDWNTSGQTIIYMAFAESPFVNSNGVPGNAR